MRQSEDEQNDESWEDEIKREDGLVRYWMFFNGDQVRLFSALAAAFFGVLWCFLYVFGAAQSISGIILLVLAAISFLAWRLLDEQVRRYEQSGWKKDRRSPQRDKIEIPIAVFLWLFILFSIISTILSRWHHGH
ncbi:MAG TPA: hypothetical protein VKP61_10920 [Candidatus Acidoferrum sp.]|nr:hypothetical protein [Candidatus Acidoferrum sp.]